MMREQNKGAFGFDGGGRDKSCAADALIGHAGFCEERGRPSHIDNSLKSEVEVERLLDRLMNAAKSILLKLIDEIPENKIGEVIDFILFLKNRQDSQMIFKDLLSASESSIDFWHTDIDDEVWNNV